MKKIVIIGLGEVGRAIEEIVREVYPSVYTKDKEKGKIFSCDMLHICYPYTKQFVEITNNYILDYSPELTIIHSTVPVGTCRNIKGKVVHAPVRGRHATLKDGILKFVMFIGYNDKSALEIAGKYFNTFGIFCRDAGSFETSELIKLLSLTYYAYMIEFARYADKCCKKFGVDYNVFKDYTYTYNEGMVEMETPEFLRSNLDPPEGRIGGHCVVQALEKIYAQVPDEAIKVFLKTNRG